MNISNLLGLTIPEGRVVVNRETCTVTFVKSIPSDYGVTGGVYYFDKNCELQFLDLPDTSLVGEPVTIEVLKDSLMANVCEYGYHGCFTMGIENITPLSSTGFDGMLPLDYSVTAAIINGDATIEF